ncbi:MAG: gamma-polyglutamate synthase [Gammaproteobacteria bacterium]|nr:gamma-polyglutamate synthase [Gammaproteobacteria bacterium]
MRALLGEPYWGAHLPNATLFAIAVTTFLACLIWMWLSALRHRARLRAVPVRIHVAGTRGKSTTTRMIAAGLRAGGRKVLAKTTGSEPRLILPNGTESIWPRRGPAAVREQTRLFAKASQLGVDTVVVECMAIRPEFIWASEKHLVQATTAVITNTRPDHFEDIGPDTDAAARAAHWVVPANGQLIVTAEAMTPELQALSDRRRTSVTVVDTAGLAPKAFDRALALTVCAAHGVAADIAGPAMDADTDDLANFIERTLDIGGKRVRFANAFACNDVASLALLWPQPSNTDIVLLNARPDRPLRTKLFLEFLAAKNPMPLLFVVGDPLAMRLARRAGFHSETLRRLRSRRVDAAMAELAAATPSGGTIWGVGNYHGFGAKLLTAVARQGTPC